MIDASKHDVLVIETRRNRYHAATLVPVLSLAALVLSACDSAGTVLDDTARLAAVEQCQQMAEGAGIVGGAVNSVCNCAADRWLDKPVAERIDVSPDAIRSIINDCAGTDRGAATPKSSESY